MESLVLKRLRDACGRDAPIVPSGLSLSLSLYTYACVSRYRHKCLEKHAAEKLYSDDESENRA